MPLLTPFMGPAGAIVGPLLQQAPPAQRLPPVIMHAGLPWRSFLPRALWSGVHLKWSGVYLKWSGVHLKCGRDGWDSRADMALPQLSRAQRRPNNVKIDGSEHKGFLVWFNSSKSDSCFAENFSSAQHA